MKFSELTTEIAKYMHVEDQGMIRVSLSGLLSNRVNLSDPVWMILIGPSSGGKSQVLRPLALVDTKTIHRIDDLSENSLLSGSPTKKGDKDKSLLKRIGKQGIIIISDLTVIFSKGSESKNAILSQFRMLFDGKMTKYVGTSSEPIEWEGSLGIVAGCTPSIYAHFEDVADMGERFIYYRMKDYDVEKATRMALDRTMYGKKLDETLGELYKEYVKAVQTHVEPKEIPAIPREVHERIINISMFAANLRTPTHYDKFAKVIDRVPVPEMPMRVALQLSAIAKGLMLMNHHETGEWTIPEEDVQHIEWCAYSLANEERRACLREMARHDYDTWIRTQTMADKIGLSTSVIQMVLQHLSAIKIVRRSGSEGSLTWAIGNKKVWETIRRLEGLEEIHELGVERDMSGEELQGGNEDDQQAKLDVF